jgi:Fic family protein
VNLISAIHEYKGKQDLFIEAQADSLRQLLEIAKIQSAGASNRIEGIHTSDERLAALISMKAEPRNRSEEENAGYREVLNLIHGSYDYIPVTSAVILQLHRDLYQYTPAAGGRYKNADNIIAETNAAGRNLIRFQPVAAFETPEAMENLCAAFTGALAAGRYDPLMLIPIFILDFLCIHPFADGNGRMSRLLTLLTLYRAGYLVGKYVSIEMIIEQTKESYYEALRDSSGSWHEGKNMYFPFVRYSLGVILKAYKEFSGRVTLMSRRGLSKPQRIRALFADTLHTLSKADILAKFPDISSSTVEQALSALLKEGYIMKTGAGRKTAYIRNMKK